MEHKPVFPMLLTLSGKPFDDEGYFFEFKFDGVRMIADLRESKIGLYNRKANDRTLIYPEIIKELQGFPNGVVLDGEVIAIDESGRQSFYLLLERDLSKKPIRTKARFIYAVFDVIYFDGADITKKPLYERKAILDCLFESKSLCAVTKVDSFRGIGRALFEVAKSEELEGIVAKKVDSLYFSGTRSKDWLKIKRFRYIDAFVIGYVMKNRVSLCLGIKNGECYKYVGNASNGLTERESVALVATLEELKTDTSCLCDGITEGSLHARRPVNNPVRTARSSDTLIYTKPLITVRVKYLEREPDGKLRQPCIVAFADVRKNSGKTHGFFGL